MAKAGQPAFVIRSLGTVLHIPVSDGVKQIKKIANAPEGYEFTCLITIGYPEQYASCRNISRFSQLFLCIYLSCEAKLLIPS